MSTQHIAEVSEFHIMHVAYDIMTPSLTYTRIIQLAAPSATPTMQPTAAPSTSLAQIQQAAAAMAEGLELFAMAKAIPRLQSLDGASFKLCFHPHHHHHLYYFTCHQADILDLQLQMITFM